MTDKITTSEIGKAIIRAKGEEIEVPIRTETTVYHDGRQDVTLRLPSLSTIAGAENGKRDI